MGTSTQAGVPATHVMKAVALLLLPLAAARPDTGFTAFHPQATHSVHGSNVPVHHTHGAVHESITLRSNMPPLYTTQSTAALPSSTTLLLWFTTPLSTMLPLLSTMLCTPLTPPSSVASCLLAFTTTSKLLSLQRLPL